MKSKAVVPRWVEVLLSDKFFNACVVHQDSKKNEKNIFCLDCCFSLCPHCLSPHSSHRLLQIRRYVYHDVLRLDDAQKLFDCELVQSYITNSARVVFIRQRAQTRQCRGGGAINICITCRRALQHPFLFCSLSCKIDDMVKTQGELSNFLLDCNFLALSEEDTPDALSDSGGATSFFGTTEAVFRKKRSSVSAACRAVACPPVSEISGGLVNRRKGTPQRSPLY